MNKQSLAPMAIIIAAMVVLNLLNGQFSDFGSWFISELLMLPGIVIGLSFHEFAHGAVSYACGDPTPKLQGRLTINPVKHMDIIGFVCLLFAGFGWGIPVQIDPRYYKHKRLDQMLVAFAGVAMNFIIAILFSFILHIIVHTNSAFFVSTAGSVIIQMLQYVVMINVVLMIFNLIPVPPLDGFGIITQIFNLEKYSWYWKVYDKGYLILLVLVLFNITSYILNPGISFIENLLVTTIIY
ncbi:site-2 protease family protein [Aminicella lysinilytica]|uniref:site-2 protease family protein n=1 Tax=Aminicella lysinilytica TaxID=433323 RepID=UPI0026ECB945|nr:site-2 protease family protein [Aminicella lysinilytica]